MTLSDNVDPAAEPISHEQRKAPAISSYPPVIFIISLKKKLNRRADKSVINRFSVMPDSVFRTIE